MNTLSRWQKSLVALGILIVIVAIGYYVYHNDRKVNNNPNACINKTFKLGSSGNCISDGQRLINWYLYGIDGPSYMKITGSFSTNMQSDLKKIQGGASLGINGELDPPTWLLLCQASNTPTWWASAAKNAGCTLD